MHQSDRREPRILERVRLCITRIGRRRRRLRGFVVGYSLRQLRRSIDPTFAMALEPPIHRLLALGALTLSRAGYVAIEEVAEVLRRCVLRHGPAPSHAPRDFVAVENDRLKVVLLK